MKKFKILNLNICLSQSSELGKGIPYWPPPHFCLGMHLCLYLVSLVWSCSLWFLVDVLREYSHPDVGGRGPSLIDWEYSASR